MSRRQNVTNAPSRRPLVARRAHPCRELEVARLRALGVDALRFAGGDAILAKARDAAARALAAVIRDDRVAERPLSLAAPHQAVDVVRPQIVLDHAEPEGARARIARAGERRRPSGERDLARLIEAGHVGADHVLEPADDLHAALACGGQHVGEHVVVAVVRRFLRRDGRFAVVLRMRRRELAAVEVVVVLLLAVVGQRAAARLPSADAAAVGERREEDRVDRRETLEVVEHALGAFVDERHRAGLDADHRRLARPKRDRSNRAIAALAARALDDSRNCRRFIASLGVPDSRRMYGSRPNPDN